MSLCESFCCQSKDSNLMFHRVLHMPHLKSFDPNLIFCPNGYATPRTKTVTACRVGGGHVVVVVRMRLEQSVHVCEPQCSCKCYVCVSYVCVCHSCYFYDFLLYWLTASWQCFLANAQPLSATTHTVTISSCSFQTRIVHSLIG